jgi:hypothetical protein
MAEDVFKGTRAEAQTIGVSSSVVLPINQERKVFVLRNSSTGGQIITLNIGMSPAILNEGIVLSSGQAYSENNAEQFECWKGQIQAISDVAGAILSVFER